MKIAYLAAGAAGMYCGTCLHDNTLAAALLAGGEDVLLVPTYTPIRTDEVDVSQHRVLYGGINVYLQQKLALFRHTPWFLDRLLDSPRLLTWLTRRGASTRADKLGDITISMIHGEEGHQRKELEKLVHWLATEVRPDVVHLSNSMLAGMARRIRERLGVPVVCSLSGEDIFLEKLTPPYRAEARRLLQERAADVTTFVAMNRYFADYMAQYLGVASEQVVVIPHGLNLAGHAARQRPADAEGFTIGYFARVCHDKGLHHLVEAFKLLRDDPTMPPLRLRAAGYLGPDDRGYLESIQARVAEFGLEDVFEYAGELDRAGKVAFLQSLDVMSVPTVYHESKGISVLEAMANAVPVVLPEHGAFPELIAATGGGLLHRPEDPATLAAALKTLLSDPARAAAMGRAGHEAVHAQFTAQLMAERTLALYREVCQGVPSKV